MKIQKIYDNCINEELIIIIGTSALENWKIIDESDENDIWFHLDNYPSSHVILKTNNKTLESLNKQTLIHCGSICKKHSKYSNIKNIDVIYTLIKNITKSTEIGSVNTKLTKKIKI
jgi:predicted ribosome quality control (RQC) complex YloA/Tae2 family protein